MSFVDSLRNAEMDKLEREKKGRESRFEQYVKVFYDEFKNDCIRYAESGFKNHQSASRRFFEEYLKDDFYHENITELAEEFGNEIRENDANKMKMQIEKWLVKDGFTNFEVVVRRGNPIYRTEEEWIEYSSGEKIFSALLGSGQEGFSKKKHVIDGYLYYVNVKVNWE